MARKPTAPRDPYGAWLHHLRGEANLSQEELSGVNGIPQTTIAYWEKTGQLRGRNEIIALARALGVPVDKLLRVKK